MNGASESLKNQIVDTIQSDPPVIKQDLFNLH